MFRPAKIIHPLVVNDGKPFDACKGFLTVKKTEESVTNQNLELAQCIVIFQHAKALNPFIKVTQAVLEAINKVPEAKFWVGDDETKYKLERPCNTYVSLNDEWNNGRDFDDGGIPYTSKLQIGDYIQADCPLALQVLLGFIIEGVPVND